MKLNSPSHWVKTNISDAFIEVKDRAMPDDERLNYIGLEHLKGGGGITTIGNAQGLKSQKTVFKKGDVLYGKLRPYLDKHAKVDFDGICSTDILVYRAVDEVQSSLLNYFLGIPEIVTYLDSKSKGISLPRVSPQVVGKLTFPLPPLAEQRRIVAKLDAAMERLRAVEAILEAVPGMLEDFRRSVLHWAVTGKLTEGWRKENKIDEWKTEQIEQLVETVTKGASPNWQGIRYVDDPNQTLFITSENVSNFEIILDKEKYVENLFNDKHERSLLKNGDVLTNIVGASIGRTAVWEFDKLANVNQAVALIRPNQKVLSSNYLAAFLNSPIGINELLGSAVDVARANVSLSSIKKIKVPLPTLKEQKLIEEKVDEFFNSANGIKISFDEIKFELSNFRQSLLTRAFQGELLSAAEVVKVQYSSDYEPASVLLEKIKAEKAKLEKEMKEHRGKARGQKSSSKKTGMKKAEDLQAIIIDKFKGKPFTFDELRKSVASFQYEDLKRKLFAMLDEDAKAGQPSLFEKNLKLQMAFKENKGKIEFTTVSE